MHYIKLPSSDIQRWSDKVSLLRKVWHDTRDAVHIWESTSFAERSIILVSGDAFSSRISHDATQILFEMHFDDFLVVAECIGLDCISRCVQGVLIQDEDRPWYS